MAVKKSIGYREIISDINKGNFAPIYILMGEEPYYLDMIGKALENKVLEEEERDFNQNIYYGNDTDPDIAITTAKQFPVMAPRRLVMYKEAQSMPGGKKGVEKFEPYMLHPNKSAVFVIIFKGDSLSATSKMMKAAQKAGAVIFNSPKVRDYNVGTHVKDYCSSRQVNINEKALAMLTDYVGASLSKLFGEIDKLIIASGQGKGLIITPEMIERNIGVSKDFNSFELVEAVSNANYAKAMRIVDGFAKNPRQNPTVLICSVLFSFYQKMVIAGLCRDRSDGALMSALGLKTPYALKDVKNGLRYINAMKAIRCIDAIRRFDAMTKGIGSMQKEHELLKELIFKLFTIKASV